MPSNFFFCLLACLFVRSFVCSFVGSFVFACCTVLKDLQLPSGVRGQDAALRLVGKVSQST